jgi:hypothetical protein
MVHESPRPSIERHRDTLAASGPMGPITGYPSTLPGGSPSTAPAKRDNDIPITMEQAMIVMIASLNARQPFEIRILRNATTGRIPDNYTVKAALVKEVVVRQKTLDDLPSYMTPEQRAPYREKLPKGWVVAEVDVSLKSVHVSGPSADDYATFIVNLNARPSTSPW